jgi:leukotriene-A4 hydrolase
MSLVSLLRDPSSHSNPDEARITHLSWDAVIDFDQQKFFATATYDVVTTIDNNNCSTLRLDTSNLDVQSVTVNGSPATFAISLPNPTKLHLGSCLEIDLRSGSSNSSGGGNSPLLEKEVISVSIQYSTSSNASAVQWLPPSQTAGKEHPYVFSACFVSVLFRCV